MPTLAIAPNLSIRDACLIAGWSKSWYYTELKRPGSEVPRPIKIGKRSFVRSDELERFISSCPRLGAIPLRDEIVETSSTVKTAERKQA